MPSQPPISTLLNVNQATINAPANMRIDCKTSVTITAFSPPTIVYTPVTNAMINTPRM